MIVSVKRVSQRLFGAIVAKAGRIGEVLGWKPRLNNLDTIVGHALSWEKRLIDYRAAS